MKVKFTDLVNFTGRACRPFGGQKYYISTGCVHDDHIADNEVEIIDYENKPSRANLEVMDGDIIFAKMQGTKKTLVINDELANHIYSTGFCAICPKNNTITHDCLYYLISSKLFLDAKDKNCSGATQKAITKAGLSRIELSIPSIKDQEKISVALKKLDAIIWLRNRQLQQLDTLVKARFVEMFGLPGTDPFGYGKTKLGSCCEINPRKADDKRLVNNIKVSFVPMPSVSENGEIDASDIRTYNEVKKCFTYFAENDVLFAKITPCMENGKGAVAKGLINGVGFGSTEFHVLRPIDNLSNPRWIYTVTSFKTFRKDAESNMTGSAGQRRTPASFLENYEISIPPIELQDQFANFVSQVDKSKFASMPGSDYSDETKLIVPGSTDYG